MVDVIRRGDDRRRVQGGKAAVNLLLMHDHLFVAVDLLEKP